MGLKNYIKRGIEYIIHGTPIKQTIADIHYTERGNILSGKKIIITGGGRGLGLSMAEKFISEGAKVLIAGRNQEVLKSASERLGCLCLEIDVTHPKSFSDFIRQADRLVGGIDVLVNNAGISLHEESFLDVTFETYNAQMSTNLTGGFFLTQEFIRHLTFHDKKGSVLFTSSETGDTMDYRPYGLTKVAINSLVQGLAYLYAKKGIRINAVAPGITASDMTGLNSTGNIYYQWNINNRVYMPEEVAEVACFLVSDISGCVSGQIITCNNGKSINARWK